SALLAVVVLSPLAVAGGLRPDPRGFGTHTQLGLAPCPYWSRTGKKCPWCGLTTASAWVVRGRFGSAWNANPAGCWFVLSSLAVGIWLIRVGLTGQTWPARSLDGPLVLWVLALVSVGLVVWAIRDS
ncbi:MAG TPA: DUF2752 domain-containing protein, partial [Isosphaeraceae bacterium]|nr:DUF2752 domain-containing protein [Isosphaeraceae bacterium]